MGPDNVEVSRSAESCSHFLDTSIAKAPHRKQAGISRESTVHFLRTGVGDTRASVLPVSPIADL